MVPIELILTILSVLLLLSIFASKVSDRAGVPALLLFLAIGMLAGSEGLGGIYFDNALVAQYIGVIALAIILFSGGLDTQWQDIRPVLFPGISLSLLGVMLTALVVAISSQYLLGFSLLGGLLLGAVVSSTDAAAVFSILRSRGVSLKGRLRPLLELESGSNDPMAVFLTVSFIQLLVNPDFPSYQLIPQFFIQMGVGTLMGISVGLLAIQVLNRIRLGYEGLYPVLVIAIVLFTYGLTGYLRGSGFLAVYLAGMVLGNAEFIHRRSLLRFFDGLTWLMQIAMFLTLGLLVFPSRLVAVAIPGLLIAAILIFAARPAAVFISLIPIRMSLAEKTMVAWVGLRGAAPIILATFPLLAGVPEAESLFNLVFFIVLTSVLLQGPLIPFVARWLGVDAPAIEKRGDPIEPGPTGMYRRQLRELTVPPGSPFVGKLIVELRLPAEFLVILINRENDYTIASGSTQILPNDRLLVISDDAAFQQVQARLHVKQTSEDVNS